MGKHTQSAARFSGLAERSIICSSFGKTFHVTGWKLGYCVGPKRIDEGVSKSSPIQRVLHKPSHSESIESVS